jgi:hypothetical protein
MSRDWCMFFFSKILFSFLSPNCHLKMGKEKICEKKNIRKTVLGCDVIFDGLFLNRFYRKVEMFYF